jgi:hypothetical protein
MLKRLCLVLALTLALPGCAALMSALSIVDAAVSEAGLILDVIDSAAKQYFAANPDSDKKELYGEAMAKARLSLAAAVRMANGVEKLDQQKIDEAFAEFRKAYSAVLALAGPLGIVKPSGSEGYSVSVGGAAVSVPEPMALTLQVE